MKVKESKKVGLKLNIQKVKIMASGPIVSWQIYEETMETDPNYILCNKMVVYSMNSFPEFCKPF